MAARPRFRIPQPDGHATAPAAFLDELIAFKWRDRATEVRRLSGSGAANLPVLVNEFWTSRQRAASSLHEISYRACFKPQLPAFFIERLTRPGGVVYDPFTGRGTTMVEAALRARVPFGSDVNPLSRVLVWPRLQPPSLEAVRSRLEAIDLPPTGDAPSDDLLAFYHVDTLRDIDGLRSYLLERERTGGMDPVDEWIRMVAVNRLTGHSSGFFSVYTLPPNQALSAESQRKINHDRRQVPPPRDVKALILRKTASLLSKVTERERTNLEQGIAGARWNTGSSAEPSGVDGSVDLVVTSPPFLDVVDYAGDNWLRCWFCGIDPATVKIAIHKRLDEWEQFIGRVFAQLARLLRPGGWIAFEVGEVRQGQVRLEESVVPCGVRAGLQPVAVLINDQVFTKTANIWGVANNRRGTNTNRIVVFRQA